MALRKWAAAGYISIMAMDPDLKVALTALVEGQAKIVDGQARHQDALSRQEAILSRHEGLFGKLVEGQVRHQETLTRHEAFLGKLGEGQAILADKLDKLTEHVKRSALLGPVFKFAR